MPTCLDYVTESSKAKKEDACSWVIGFTKCHPLFSSSCRVDQDRFSGYISAMMETDQPDLMCVNICDYMFDAAGKSLPGGQTEVLAWILETSRLPKGRKPMRLTEQSKESVTPLVSDCLDKDDVDFYDKYFRSQEWLVKLQKQMLNRESEIRAGCVDTGEVDISDPDKVLPVLKGLLMYFQARIAYFDSHLKLLQVGQLPLEDEDEGIKRLMSYEQPQLRLLAVTAGQSVCALDAVECDALAKKIKDFVQQQVEPHLGEDAKKKHEQAREKYATTVDNLAKAQGYENSAVRASTLSNGIFKIVGGSGTAVYAFLSVQGFIAGGGSWAGITWFIAGTPVMAAGPAVALFGGIIAACGVGGWLLLKKLSKDVEIAESAHQDADKEKRVKEADMEKTRKWAVDISEIHGDLFDVMSRLSEKIHEVEIAYTQQIQLVRKLQVNAPRLLSELDKK